VPRRSLAGLATLVVILAAWAPGASAGGVGEVTCSGTFEVLHDDRIGALAITAGPYDVTLLAGSTLTCADAYDLFRGFLEDYDGRLSGGWTVDPATASFTRRGAGFRITRAAGPPSRSTRVCPSYFTVEHNDRIGNFSIRRGRYRIVLLSVGALTCSKASTYLARFLQDWDGVLPRPWVLDPGTGSFQRGSRHNGFRIETWKGPLPPSGGGGGTHPADGARCPGTFRVLHTDRIGRLVLRRGPYIVTRLKSGSPSCARASQLLASFLEDYDGVLPRPWVLSTRTGTFTRGRGTTAGFRVKSVRAL
jgi:hypothetical protein